MQLGKTLSGRLFHGNSSKDDCVNRAEHIKQMEKTMKDHGHDIPEMPEKAKGKGRGRGR